MNPYFRRVPRFAALAVTSGVFTFCAGVAFFWHGCPALGRAHDTDKDVVAFLDSFVQPRFQDDRAGVFGMERVITREELAGVRGHLGLALLRPKTSNEAIALNHANDGHRDYVIGLMHCAHIPGQFKEAPRLVGKVGYIGGAPCVSVLVKRPAHPEKFLTPVSVEKKPDSDQDVFFESISLSPGLQERISSVAISALPRVIGGKPCDIVSDDYLISLRPVLALKDSCLSCHVGAKKGDTLGVMVYAVGRHSLP